MEDSPTSGPRRIIKLKKGEPVPDNVHQLTDSDILIVQSKRIKNFTPQSEVYIFKYSQHIISVSVAMSGFVINKTFRNNFRLGGLKMGLTYGLSVALPAIFSVGVHDVGIKHSILLGKEPCSTCVNLKSGAYQVFMGVCYPYVASVISCVKASREFYTLPLPKKMGYLSLLRLVSPSGFTLLNLCLINMFIGMLISKKEWKLYMKHFTNPPPPGHISTTGYDLRERGL